MVKKLLALLLLLGTGVLAAQEPRLCKAPPIEKVTLYRDRAVVIRSVKVDLKAGGNLLRFERLSPNMKDVSLRATLSDSTKASILNIASWKDQYREIQDAEVKKCDTEIVALDKQIISYSQKLQRLAVLVRYLDAYKNKTRVAMSHQTLAESPELEKWAQTLTSLNTRHTTYVQRQSEQLRQLKELQAKRTNAEMRLRKLENPQPRAVRTVEVLVQAKNDCTQELQVMYEMSNAGWYPLYEIQESEKGIKLVCFAGMHQNTEEDWKRVKVALSTAEPAEYTVRPKLRALALRAVEANNRRKNNPVAQVREVVHATAPDIVAMTAGATMEMELRKEATSFALELPDRVSIPRDGRLAKIEVAQGSIKQKSHFWSVPVKSNLVYRRLEGQNPLPFPLLEGPYDVFHNGSYTGTAQLPFTPVGGSFVATTGVDPEIGIRSWTTRKNVKDTSSRANRTMIRTIRVTNNKASAVTVTIVGQIPVSEIEEAEVRLLSDDMKIKPAKYDKKKGHLYWDVTLAKGKEQKFSFAYQLTGPRSLIDRIARPTNNAPYLYMKKK